MIKHDWREVGNLVLVLISGQGKQFQREYFELYRCHRDIRPYYHLIGALLPSLFIICAII